MLMSKLSEIGILRLIPRMLAFKAVQRQSAASRSIRPPSKEQHGWSGGAPTSAPTAPLSNLAHTPSFRASLGHFPVVVGVGLGLGFAGLWGMPQPGKQAFAATRKRRLVVRKRIAYEDFMAQSLQKKLSAGFCDIW